MKKLCILGLTVAAVATAGSSVAVHAKAQPISRQQLPVNNIRVIRGNRESLEELKEKLCALQENGTLKWDSIVFDKCPQLPENNQPETGEPDTETPDTSQPDTETPDTSQPDTETPDITQPDTEQPGDNTPDTPENGSQPEEDLNASYARQVVSLVNAERAKEGLQALSIDEKLEQAAMVRAGEIQTSFSHTRPNGSSFSTVLKENGISYRGSGENIAWGQKTPQAVVEGWMNSPSHRANIMNSKYTSIGVGNLQNARGTQYWVQLFTY